MKEGERAPKADLPALAYQVWMKRECESFMSAVDAVDMGGVDGWWEGIAKKDRPGAPEARG